VINASAVKRVLHRFARRKRQLFGSRDLDGCTGCGIAALALGRLLDLELSERRDRRFRASLRCLSDLAEDAFNDGLGLCLGQVLLGCNLVGDFGLSWS